MTIENPTLKTAMKQIELILRHHDIAGYVVLSSGEQCEFLNFIGADGQGPSWSCLHLIPGGVRFKSAASKNLAERFNTNSTVKMIFSMTNLMLDQSMKYVQICELLESKMNIEHGGSQTQPHVD